MEEVSLLATCPLKKGTQKVITILIQWLKIYFTSLPGMHIYYDSNEI